MKLSQLLLAAGIHAPAGEDPLIHGVTDDSRRVQPGWLFLAVQGTQVDGRRFVPQALEAGAAAVVAMTPAPGEAKAPWIVVPDTQRALGQLAHAFAGRPSDSMIVVGVTGTNGKTTAAWLIESMFRAAGRSTALLGTLHYRIGGETYPAPTTTASACRNAEMFALMRDQGVQAVAMEVSSHAIDQRRIEGIRFRAGVLTNITQDHLDYHKTMEEYTSVKQRFFTETIASTPDAVAVFNLDDEAGRRFSRAYGGEQVGFSQTEDCRVRCLGAQVDLQGVRMRVSLDGQPLDLRSRLLGRFNVENILAAVAGGLASGLDCQSIAAGVEAAGGVPGRFQRIDEGQPFLVAVDYAHTPDALERALANARELTAGRLILVFGCGGDRDATKRPKMGFAAGRAADYSILTNDNPRTEDPQAIARMAEEGLRRSAPSPHAYEVTLDRRLAIQRALEMAEPGDFVLIAGKGHEDYQLIGSQRIHFDDRETARELLRARFCGGGLKTPLSQG